MRKDLKRRAICTIIANNYIAFARTLVASVLAAHPDCTCYVLLADEFEGLIDPAAEQFEIVTMPELGISDLSSFCFKYDVTELSTAAKPYLLEFLLAQRGLDQLLYIDPDILVTNPLDRLFQRLETYDIVLTPHLDTDYPDDGLLPNDAFILKSGVFNLGFIGIRSSPSVRKFLHWWQGKVYDKCVIDHAKGYFVDQRFIDLLPGLFDNYFVEKDTGYNVAYWNLHSRRLENENDTWTCNGSPLYFYHFSGYRINQPEAISSHITRYRLKDRPDITPLFADYHERLIKNGYEQSIGRPYSHDYFSNGQRIPKEVRVSYRNSAEEWKFSGNPFESEALASRARRLILKSKALYALNPLRWRTLVRKRVVGSLRSRK